jgi:hypothetical protein
LYCLLLLYNFLFWVLWFTVLDHNYVILNRILSFLDCTFRTFWFIAFFTDWIILIFNTIWLSVLRQIKRLVSIPLIFAIIFFFFLVCIAWLIIHFWVWRKKIFLGLLFGFFLLLQFMFFWWAWKTHLQAFWYIWKFYFFSRKQWLFNCFVKILLILKPTQGHVKNYCQSDDKLLSENVWNFVISILTIFGAFKLIVWAVCGIHHIGLQSLCYFLLDFLNDKANFLIRRPYFEFWILHKFIHFFKEVFLVKTFDPSKLVL